MYVYYSNQPSPKKIFLAPRWGILATGFCHNTAFALCFMMRIDKMNIF